MSVPRTRGLWDCYHSDLNLSINGWSLKSSILNRLFALNQTERVPLCKELLCYFSIKDSIIDWITVVFRAHGEFLRRCLLVYVM